MSRLLPFRRRRNVEIEDLYRRYAGLVERRVQRFFSADEAPEVVAEIFLRVVERFDTFKGDSALSTWLFSLTTRHCLNRLRDQKSRRRSLDLNSNLPWLRAAREDDPEAAVFLAELWNGLDAEQATIGFYHFIDGMPHSEIAELLGVSRRTIGNRIDAIRTQARAAAGRRTPND